MGTKSLVIILPIVVAPPPPRPQTALAAIKLSMLPAIAHQSVERKKYNIAHDKDGLPPHSVG